MANRRKSRGGKKKQRVHASERAKYCPGSGGGSGLLLMRNTFSSFLSFTLLGLFPPLLHGLHSLRVALEQCVPLCTIYIVLCAGLGNGGSGFV